MKLLAIFFTTALLGFSAGPQDAVMAILEKARNGEVASGKLEVLGISPHVGNRKKTMIGEQWNDLRDWMRGESAQISFGEFQEDGDLAGVVVNASAKSGPDAARTLSLGVKKVGNVWKVAPLFGQFANAGLGFDEDVLKRARALEQWMAAREAAALYEFRKAELAKYLKTIAGKVDQKTLKEATATEAFEHFQKAVSDGDAERVLIWLGMLERSFDDERNWELLGSVVRKGIEGEDKQDVWRLLHDPAVIRLLVNQSEKNDDVSFLLGFMAPYATAADREQNRVIRFHLENTPVGWRVNLPAFFEYADQDSGSHFNAHNQNYNWEDRRYARKLGVLFEKKNKARFAKSPEELLKTITVDFKEGSYVDFIRFLFRSKPDPEKREEDDHARAVNSRYTQMGKLWADLRGQRGGDVTVTVSEQLQQGDVAFGILCFEQPGSHQPDFKTIWMLKQEEGWTLVPNQTTLTNAPFANNHGKDSRDLLEKSKELEESLGENYLKTLFSEIPGISNTKTAPDEESAKKVVTAWRKQLAEGSLSTLLDQAAMVEVPQKPTRLMRDLSGSMKGARAATEEEKILGSKAAGRFRAVSMFVDAGRGLEMHCPLVLVAPTEKGERVLADVELWYSSNQGKRIRNGAALLRVKKILSEEDFAAVKELFDWHEKLAGPVWEEWDEQKNDQ